MLGGGVRRAIHGGEVLSYAPSDYFFRELVGEILGHSDLSQLHTERDYDRLVVGTDHATVWHQRFYAAFPAQLADLFRYFIQEDVRPLFGEPIVHQRVPTFRVHLPGNVGVGEFHADGQYNHPDGEINFLLPLTDCRETASIWIESAVGTADYRPANLHYGEVFVFDGRNLRHGNLPNETGKTRVSFDFRVIPLSQFRPSNAATFNSGLRFDIGGYYEVCL